MSEAPTEPRTPAIAAAREIWRLWRAGDTTATLPLACRPGDAAAGYRAQAALEQVAGLKPVGWKIAATALAGQRHLNVDGPIAGRLFESRVRASPATVSIGRNRFLVAEAEFAFVLGADLPPRERPYARDEIMAAVAALHPAIELPDSRFADVTVVGAAQLAADDACADWFVLGPKAPERWRELDLAAHPVALLVDGTIATEGRGADVLGDPRDALTWLANQHALLGRGLARGEVITTGVCGQPTPYRPGQTVRTDFGSLGGAEIRIEP